MLVKILLLAGVLTIIALLLFDSLPSIQEFNTCLGQMSTNYSRISSIARQKNWSNDRFCSTAHVQLAVDLVCVQNVIDRRMTARYVFWIAPDRININKTLRDYNRQCWDQQLPLYELNLVDKEPVVQ